QRVPSRSLLGSTADRPASRCSAGRGGSLARRGRVLREVVCRDDETDVRERLREVPEQALRVRVVLLRDQAEVVPESEQLLEQRDRLVAAALQHERIDEPEGARQE